MAGTVIVGRIAIKVIPDTENFGKDLKDKLDRIEKQHELKIPVALDLDKISEQFDRAQRRLESDARNNPIEIDVGLDDEKAKAAASRLHDRLEGILDDVKVDVDLDDMNLSDAASDADDLADGLDDAARGARKTARSTRAVEADLVSTEELLKRAARRLNRMDIAEALDADGALDALRATEKQVSRIADAERRLKSLNSVLGSYDLDLSEAFDELDEAALDATALAQKMEDVERAESKAADQAQRIKHEIDKIKFDEDFERQMRVTDALLEEMNEEIAELNHLEDIDLILEIQGMSKTERKIADLREQMEALRIQLTPELSDEERAKVVRKIADLADKLEDELDNLEAEIEPSIGEAFYRRAQQRLAWLSRTRIVTLVPVVSAKAAGAAATALAALSGARLQGKVIEDLFDAFKDLDKNLPKIAALGLGLAGVSGFALSAAANLFSMSKQLAQIGPIALGLPGVFTGMAIGIVTLVVALSDFNERVPEVAEAWKELKPVIQDNFWAEAEDPIRRLTEELMPQLTEGLAKTATQLGGLFGQFGEDLVKELTGTKALDQMFQDLADSIEILKDGTGDFASIIRILGEVGAKLLPRMSRYFVDISSRFENFLSKAEADGRLDMWIERAITRMRELGEVIGNFGGILSGLAKAANDAGGSTLREWADDLQAIEDKVKSPAFQEDLVKVLRAADQAMTNIAEKSGPGVNRFFDEMADTVSVVLPLVGDTIGQMLGTITDALSREGFQSGVIDFFQGIHDAVDTLSPAMAPVSDALGSLLSLAGSMAKAFSPALATTLSTLSEAVQTLAPYLERAVTALSGPLEGLLEKLAGPIDKIAKAAGPAIENVATGIGKIVEKLTPSIATTADKVADFVVQLFKSLDKATIDAIADAAVAMGEGLLDIVDSVVALGSAMAGPDGKNLQIAFKAISGVAQDNVAPVLHGIADAIRDIAASMTTTPQEKEQFGFFAGLHDDWQAVSGIIKFGIGSIKGLFGSMFLPETVPMDAWVDEHIFAPIRNAWEKFKASGFLSDEWFAQVGKDMVAGLSGGLSEKFGELTVAFQGWIDDLVNAVKSMLGIHSPSTVFAEIGRNIIAGLVQGLGERISSVTTKLSELVTQIKGKFEGAGTWLVEKGSALANGLRTGISNAAGNVTTRLSSLITSMRSLFANAGTWLVQNGSAAANGLRTGISNAAGNVRTAASNLKTAITSGVGQLGSLLVSAGYNAGAGLAQGIRNAWSYVTGVAASLARAVSSTINSALDIRSPSRVMMRSGEFVGDGLALGILDSIPAVERAAETMADAIKDTEFGAEIEMGVSKTLSKDVGRNIKKPGDDPDSGGVPAAGKTVNFNYNITNPISEPTSVTTARTLRESQDQTGETP